MMMMMLLCNFLTHLCACYCWIWGIGCSYAWVMPTTTSTTLSSKATTTTTTSIITTSSTHCTTPSQSWSLARSRLYAKGESSSEGQQQKQRQLNWLEQWAQEGAQKIANLDIEERTQRTLFAEMAEDKIYELNLQLEELMDDETGQLKEEDENSNSNIKELAEDIALQTRSLQEQYRLLVTGEPSSMLQAMSSLKNSNNNNNQQE